MAYKVWEDAAAAKRIILRPDANQQCLYVANYPWLFFTHLQKLHIIAYFEEQLDIECHVALRISYDEHRELQFVERVDKFDFSNEEGDSFEIEDVGWREIDILFEIVKLNGKEYVEPQGIAEQNLAVVNVGQMKIFVDLQLICEQSSVFNDLNINSKTSEITIFDIDPEVFLELLRVISPPFKEISRHNFVDLLLVACRFRMQRLLVRLEEFSKSDQYEKKWLTKFTMRKLERILNEDADSVIQVLDEFRVKRRREKPLKSVTIREPEVEEVIENVEIPRKGLLELLSANKTRIIFILLFVFFLENVLLLIWFVYVYRVIQ